jgi:hypothetical protein
MESTGVHQSSSAERANSLFPLERKAPSPFEGMVAPWIMAHPWIEASTALLRALGSLHGAVARAWARVVIEAWSGVEGNQSDKTCAKTDPSPCRSMALSTMAYVKPLLFV